MHGGAPAETTIAVENSTSQEGTFLKEHKNYGNVDADHSIKHHTTRPKEEHTVHNKKSTTQAVHHHKPVGGGSSSTHNHQYHHQH